MKFNSSTKKSIDITIPFIGMAITGYAFFDKSKYKDLKYIAFVAFVLLLVFIALYAVTTSVTKYYLNKAITDLPATDKADIIKETGIAGADYEVANTASIAIYSAFHSSWDEDENKAIKAIEGMKTADMVKALCAVYQRKFSLSLMSEFESYLGYFDMKRVPAFVKASWF